MIKTYVCDISPLYDEEIYNKYYAQLPEERREKADKMKQMVNKCQSVGVYILYQMALKEEKAEAASPYNFSHSGNYCICSIDVNDRHKVGCDVEVLRSMNENIAKRFYNPPETHYVLAGEDSEEISYRILRMWTLKESFMKAVKMGSNLSTKAFTIEINRDNEPCLVKKPGEYSEDFYYKDFLYQDKVQISVCSTGNISDRLISVKL